MGAATGNKDEATTEYGSPNSNSAWTNVVTGSRKREELGRVIAEGHEG